MWELEDIRDLFTRLFYFYLPITYTMAVKLMDGASRRARRKPQAFDIIFTLFFHE